MLQEIAIQKVRDFLVFKLVEFSSNSIVFFVFLQFFTCLEGNTQNLILLHLVLFLQRTERKKIELSWNFL